MAQQAPEKSKDLPELHVLRSAVEGDRGARQRLFAPLTVYFVALVDLVATKGPDQLVSYDADQSGNNGS